jgi:hypothetical protein
MKGTNSGEQTLQKVGVPKAAINSQSGAATYQSTKVRVSKTGNRSRMKEGF